MTITQEELKMLETTIELENETINIMRWGPNDYSAEFYNADCSVRGTMVQIMAEIFDIFGEEILENQ